MLFAINAGHMPGQDSGAVGTFLNEAEYVKDIAERVCSLLVDEGHEALFIQENELYDICDIANEEGADYFVSIHCNAFNTVASGTECWYHDCDDCTDYKGMRLSERIQKKLVKALGTKDRGIRAAYQYVNGLYVLNKTEMPATLVEIGFIDNAEEEILLDNNRDVIARAIVDGIVEFLENE